MALGTLFDFAADIVKDLGSLGIREVGLLWGVDKELVSLKETISTIKAVLRDAEKKRTTSDLVKDWLEKLEDAMHDADDLVDEFRTRALIQRNDDWVRKVRTFFSSSNQLGFKLSMAHGLQEVRQRLDKIKDDKAFYLLDHLQETSVSTISRETYSFVPNDEVIGREDDKGNIIKLLLNDDFEENVSVIPIVGMGGLGKTTLARRVYNDGMVTRYFKLRLWVCVSDPFDLKMILKKMLESCDVENADDLGIESLQKKVREKLDGKRYFLVLDDVWNEDRKKWIDLINLLNGGAKGSKILVTTRTNLVAKITKTSGVDPYRLDALTEETSWSLFKKMAFVQGKEPLGSETIMSIGMKIVKKCRGNPLAIKTMGSLMFTKSTEAEWLAFEDIDNLVKVIQKDDDILPTLKLSYDHLPSHLKHCFAYCSLFSKDSNIDVPTLISLWMAHGFVIASGQGQCLYDVGYGYFMELLGRSFFQEFEQDYYDIQFPEFTTTCKMHDLMHDLAISVAGRGFPGLSTDLENFHDGTLRHFPLSLNMSGKILQPLNQYKQLRTFFPLRFHGESLHCATIKVNFMLLRALNLSDMKLKTLPRGLGELIHLRYLKLSHNDMKQLPKSITRLHNLQTLDLSFCFELLSLPRDIARLVNLVHLNISQCNALTHLPSGIGQLTSLHTLGIFPIFNDSKALPRDAAGIKELNNLRGVLKIEIKGHGKHALAECKTANLNEKSLCSLIVRWDSCIIKDRDASENDEAILDCLQPNLHLKEFELSKYMGTRLSPWFRSLSNLVKLTLIRCYEIKELPPMNRFPGLKEMSLYFLSELEFVSTSDDESFYPRIMPLLESLTIYGCPKLKQWRRKEGNNDTDSEDKCSGSITEQKLNPPLPLFPSLTKLLVEDCSNLTSMPLIPNVINLHQSGKIQTELLPQLIGNSPSLRSLSFGDWELDSLPGDIFKFASLEQITILRCPNLASLPDSLSNLSSLQELRLKGCFNLVELPEAICRLKALQRLYVSNCPALEKRYNKYTGEDWPKIAHIPIVYFHERRVCFIVTDEKTKQKCIEAAADIYGVDSIAAGTDRRKLTVIGLMDVAATVKKLKEVDKDLQSQKLIGTGRRQGDYMFWTS